MGDYIIFLGVFILPIAGTVVFSFLIYLISGKIIDKIVELYGNLFIVFPIVMLIALFFPVLYVVRSAKVRNEGGESNRRIWTLVWLGMLVIGYGWGLVVAALIFFFMGK